MNLYAYVANDPVNGADPSGLCSVEVNELVDCEITFDKELTDERKEAADGFVDKLVEIGQAIYDSGDQALIDSFESIDTVAFSSKPTDEKGRVAKSDRRHDRGAVARGDDDEVMTVFGKALDINPNSDLVTHIAGHEVEHFTQRDRNISRLLGCISRQSVEKKTDKRSIKWLQEMGLLPSPYQSRTSYTNGQIFRLNPEER